MALISAIRKDQDLLDDIETARKYPEQFFCWWLGQSGFLIQYGGEALLIDPYLSDSLTRKYEGSSKPHVRMTERVIDPSKLTGIHIVTSSHNHTDHLDAETLQPLFSANPGLTMICPEANRDLVSERTGQPRDAAIGMDENIEFSKGKFQFTGIASAHNTIDRDENGNCRYMGYVIRFGQWTIYHSGDSLLYEGLAEKLQPFRPDLMLLPINGDDPSRGVAGNMNIDEAIHLARTTGTQWLIPCHYDMFAFNTANVEDFAKAAIRAQQPYCILDSGGKISGNELA